MRKARRDLAAASSGMTSDHLFPVFENEGDSEFLYRVASLVAVEQVSRAVLVAIRFGRITALSKPDGGVRGLVVGQSKSPRKW